MQKGHTRPLASLLLFCVLVAVLLIISSVASTQSSRLGAAGPLLSLDQMQRQPLLPGQTPEFFRCATCPDGQVTTQQTPGPDPDQNITAKATASQEWEPNTAPVVGQNRIAFASNGEDLINNQTGIEGPDGFIDPTLPENPDFDLWLMRPDGTQQQKVIDLPGDQRDPAFDPGGRLLAYASNHSGTYQIYTVEVSTGVTRRITTPEGGAGNKRHPTWSADSNWIAFQCDRRGNWDIFKILSNGASAEIPLAFSSNDEVAPAWSPTTPYIAYQVTINNVSRIFSMDTEGGNRTQLSNGGGNPNANDIDPAWQPLGQSLVFASDRLVPDSGDTTNDYNIWTMSATGEIITGAASLISSDDPNDVYDDKDPTWTPDLTQRAQTRFVFASNRPVDANDTSEPDIWATFEEDILPPELTKAPGRENALPWVDIRNPAPGADITISVSVYDRDSGVASVVALLKDPEMKLYDWSLAIFEPTNNLGWQALERDCVIVDGKELLDDGVPPDQTAGDGIFTGTYTTLPTPRDYIIDIATVDVVGNGMTYDDIYGFSTVTFNPNDRVLFVDDYCEGQAFIYLTGINNDWPAQFPVESYYRCNPGYYPGLERTIDFDSIIAWAVDYDTSGFGDGPAEEHCTSVDIEGHYDVWRILCRGPIPDTILRNYLPTVEYQLVPEDALADPTWALPTREVLVANRAVIWAAPHTGDVWIADGTIMDAAVQGQLKNFLNQGGRLFISGEDLAWALTMAGRTSNDFLSRYLRAQYLSDVAGGDGFTVEGNNDPYSPVSWDAWVGTGASHPGVAPNWWPDCCNPVALLTPVASTAGYSDAADHLGRGRGGSVRADGIVPSGDVKLYGYGGFGGTGAATWYADPATGAHVVYLAFGFEDIHRSYRLSGTSPPPHCHNHRSHLFHNFLCWARTAAFQGRVVSISEGGQPVTDPEPIVVITQGNNRYAVRCQKDGTYVIQGVKSGQYSMQVIRVGYEIDHAEGEHAHGGWAPVQVDFAIKEAQPGAIAGTVVSEASGDPIANVTVTVYAKPEPEPEPEPGQVVAAQDEGDIPIEDLGDPVVPPVHTGADGTFVIPEVPVGDYIVVADGTAAGYGTQQLETTVTPGDSANLAFVLGAAAGALEVHVTAADTGDDIENATIQVLDENGQQVVVPAPMTGPSGIVNIPLPAGDYQVRAASAGYEASTLQGVVVVSQETTHLDIALNRVADGAVSGKVTSATTGQPVGDVLIRVLSGGTVRATGYTSDQFTDPGDGTPSYNYFIPDVPAGEVTVQPVVSGYDPQPDQRVVTVVSGETITGVSFVLESLHVFPQGLQLISLPWDFSSGQSDKDPANLLGIPASQFLMATWETSTARYRIYPNAPADRFRLGTGYWLNLASPADLAQEGTPPLTVHQISLLAGWNLIGDPFLSTIDFYATNIRAQNGTLYSVQEALAQNLLGSGLFAYMLGGYRIVSALTPYVGYWLYANDPCKLVIDESTDTMAVGTQAAAPAVPVPADGWLLQLQTTATVAGLQDTAAYLGTAAGASDDFDPGLDQAKPPVPISGGYVYLSLGGASGPDMAVDIRSQQSSQQQWDLEVQTNLSGQPIEISWPDMSGLPPATQPILTDLATGKRLYMRTNRAYSFAADGTNRRLRVSTSAAGVGQLAITAAAASTTPAAATVSYTLSRNAQVSIDVYNISGRLISRVLEEQTQTAGLQSVAWHGRNNAGVKVPNGRYLVRITARTDDGQQAQALTQMAITR